MNPAVHALNRFGFGARPGQSRVLDDPRAWLRTQLRAGAPMLPVPDQADPATIASAMRIYREQSKIGKVERQQARNRLIAIAAAEGRAALVARATSERPFVERLVAFWSNHLCVSIASKALITPLAGSYEREAIRPHVLGRFEDMVRASAQHPAMLLYLDNIASIGPQSRGARAGRRRGKTRGLNENYARELLELHTLGVDGGYTQQDVQELARMLTGWTVSDLQRARSSASGAGDGYRFEFDPKLHEPGAKTLLGKRYPEAGVHEGEQAIGALARHPSTAAFIATKLARHFVGDEPPPAAVARLARVFRESDGDLGAVSSELVALPEAWSAETRKFRSPQDWLVAMLRACSIEQVSDLTFPTLRRLRHPLWAPQSPKGFGDTAADWSDPDSLLNRAELARSFARRVRRQGIDPAALAEVVDLPQADPLRRFLADTSITVDERIALALAGPAFQWR